MSGIVGVDTAIPKGIGVNCADVAANGGAACPNTSVTTQNFTTNGASDFILGGTTANVTGAFTHGSGAMIIAQHTSFASSLKYYSAIAAGTQTATFTSSRLRDAGHAVRLWLSQIGAGRVGTR